MRSRSNQILCLVSKLQGETRWLRTSITEPTGSRKPQHDGRAPTNTPRCTSRRSPADTMRLRIRCAASNWTFNHAPSVSTRNVTLGLSSTTFTARRSLAERSGRFRRSVRAIRAIVCPPATSEGHDFSRKGTPVITDCNHGAAVARRAVRGTPCSAARKVPSTFHRRIITPG